jgi:hypothetical protein
MALPRWLRRRLHRRAVELPVHTLFPRWYGRVAVVSHATDPPALLWRLLRRACVDPGPEALILVTGRALADPACGTVLRGTVEHATQVLDAGRIWLAADGLGRPDEPHAIWLQRLAARCGAELLAPTGPIHLTADGTHYVADGTGAMGWRSFRPGADSAGLTYRYPTPPWESALPARSVPLPGLVADPIPAGFLLRAATGSMIDRTDPALCLPVDRRGPTLALRHVGEPQVDPELVAAVFAGLPAWSRVRVELGLLDPDRTPPRPQWLDRLVRALDAPSGGARTAGLQPVVRRRLAGPAPSLLRTGWVRARDRFYHHAVESQLLAEVSATGVLLRAAGHYRVADLAFVDPAEGLLKLDAAASELLVADLCRAVAAAPGGLRVDLGAEHPATEKLAALLDSRPASSPTTAAPDLPRVDILREPVSVAGRTSRSAVPLTAEIVAPRQPAPASTRTVLDLPSVPVESARSVPVVAQLPTVVPAQPVASPAAAPVEPAAPGEWADRIVQPPVAEPFVPAVPQSTTAPPAQTARPDAGEPAGVRRDTTSITPSLARPPVITSSGPDLELTDDDGSPNLPSTTDDSPPVAVLFPPTSVGAPDLTEPGGAPAVDRYVAAAAITMPDRDSTVAEQREFTAALGTAYTDSITTVNAALAAWPALRQDMSAQAKTDLVAVRVFFGRSELGAARLNARLRAGHQRELPGYLSCLVSGLRRLPPCRRAMLCQGRLAVPARRLYPEGATLVEPGFRSVSGAGLAVEGADVDYLVWSRTARQAGALAGLQELDEAVFLAGARFKVLAVREGDPPPAEEVAIPTTAVLLREMLPGEPETSGLDEADRTALTRLERALRRRWSAAAQPLTDEEAIDRLAGPPIGYVEHDAAAAGPGQAQT